MTNSFAAQDEAGGPTVPTAKQEVTTLEPAVEPVPTGSQRKSRRDDESDDCYNHG